MVICFLDKGIIIKEIRMNGLYLVNVLVFSHKVIEKVSSNRYLVLLFWIYWDRCCQKYGEKETSQ